MTNLELLKQYAIKNDIPIIKDDGKKLLLECIKKHNIKSVLEIGTAIAYSSICMALAGCEVTSVERDFDRYCQAYQNVRNFNLQDKIKLVYNDAFLYYPQKKYDLLFIDAAKAQSIAFLQHYKYCLKKGSVVLVDNINFHSLTFNDEKISRDLQEMTRKIRNYVNYMLLNKEFKSRLYSDGDGMMMSIYLKE